MVFIDDWHSNVLDGNLCDNFEWKLKEMNVQLSQMSYNEISSMHGSAINARCMY